jgi:cytidylate kinase
VTRDIAIDGPSGSGKTSIGVRVADELRLMFVDSGLLYRVFTAAYCERFADVGRVDLAGLRGIASERVRYMESGEVLYGGRHLAVPLHGDPVDGLVSPVSAVPSVRSAVNRELRRISSVRDVVMAGRDIGTTVLPHAFLKVFITAPAEVRALRRAAQLNRLGVRTTMDDALANIVERDRIDSTRKDSPLRCTPDHLLLDNSGCGIDGIAAMIAAEYGRRLNDAV